MRAVALAVVLFIATVWIGSESRAQYIPMAFWKPADGVVAPQASSLRFRAANSAYLGKTFAGAGNRKTWTWSGWVKRGTLGVSQYFWSAGVNSGTDFTLMGVNFQSDNTIRWLGGSGSVYRVTTQVFRDPTAWYHIALAFDTTLATATDRIKIFVNGVRITSFSSATDPSQNTDYPVNQAAAHNLGRWAEGSSYFDGYMADVFFIDGQALTASAFGETDSNGMWVPKTYGGTYGTNGFYLNFADTSNLGKDATGSNNWTPNNFSTAAGPTYDPLDDDNENSSAGTYGRGNFATLNPLDVGSVNMAISDAGLTFAKTGANFSPARATSGVSSGKWYFEMLSGAGGIKQVGVSDDYNIRQAGGDNSVQSGIGAAWDSRGFLYRTGTSSATGGYLAPGGNTFTTNDLVMIAFDADTGKIWFGKNGVWNDSGNPGAGTGPSFTAAGYRVLMPFVNGESSGYGTVNFGQRPFAYTPPSGFWALNTNNLATPAITKPSDYFKTITYTGNGGWTSIGSPPKLSGGPNIAQSLRFNRGDGPSLSRTFAVAGNQKTWTWSGWHKRTDPVSNNQMSLFGLSGSATDYLQFPDNASLGKIQFYVGSGAGVLLTKQLFRDPTQWTHIVAVVDTTQATASERLRLYINGQRVTAFDTAIYPGQNTNTGISNNAVGHSIGSTNGTNYLDGYLADVYFIDGQALGPGDFGQWNSQGNVWVPKVYSGTYGTNGFHLMFDDKSNTTATTLGADTSGNGNNWTPNNFSVTAGAGDDALRDVPSDYSDGSGDHANFATLNKSDCDSNIALTNGSLTAAQPASNSPRYLCRTPFYLASGKWYYEWSVDTQSAAAGHGAGVAPSTAALSAAGVGGGAYNDGIKGLGSDGSKWTGDGVSRASVTSSFAVGAIVGVAIDADAGKIWYRVSTIGSNAWISGDPVAGTSPTNTFTGAVAPTLIDDTSSSATLSFNFGQRGFNATPPTGFVAINTYNIPTTGFVPDLVWIKRRSNTSDHALYDSARGVTLDLAANSTAAEAAQSTGLLGFNAGGFSVGSLTKVNDPASTFVAWMWKKGATPGFDIVTYTGTGSVQNINHSLGAVPQLIIVKNRTQAQPWHVYTAMTGNSNALFLNATDASTAGGTAWWNSTTPTSSVFTVNTSGGVNGSGHSFVAYLWAEVPGFSKFGSYTGNGSTDGPFIYTGFKPAFVLVKRIDGGAENWLLYDNGRSPYNPVSNVLLAQLANAEDTTPPGSNSNALGDMTANGFKIRSSGGSNNTSGGTYIYAAFAETPFKYSRAR